MLPQDMKSGLHPPVKASANSPEFDDPTLHRIQPPTRMLKSDPVPSSGFIPELPG